MNKLTTQSLKLFVLLVLTAGFGYLMVGASQSSSTDLQDQARKTESTSDKPGPENGYKFSEASPTGDWLAQADIDVIQSNDPNNPVVIAAIRSYVGKGSWRKQLMIESVTLKNRTTKSVKAIRLGWIVIAEDDVKVKKNREAALVQGYTQLFTQQVPPNGFMRLASIDLEFVRAAKSLIPL